MGLIKCPDCGKEFSERANACPNCGCPKDSILMDVSDKKTELVEEIDICGFLFDKNIANEIDQLLFNNKKMDAIKIFRDYSGEQDLKICKEAIENRIKELGIVNQESTNVKPEKSSSKSNKKMSDNKSKRDSFSIILAVFCLMSFFIPFFGIVISVLAIVREMNNSKKYNREISKVLYVYIFTALLSSLFTIWMLASTSSNDKNNELANANINVNNNEEVVVDLNSENDILEETPEDVQVSQNLDNDIPAYTAEEMLNEFENNKLRAKDEFDGLYLSVTGVVEKISEDGNYIYITNSQYALYNIKVSVDFEKYKNIIYNLSAGDQITVIGTCSYIYDPVYVMVYSIEAEEIIQK